MQQNFDTWQNRTFYFITLGKKNVTTKWYYILAIKVKRWLIVKHSYSSVNVQSYNVRVCFIVPLHHSRRYFSHISDGASMCRRYIQIIRMRHRFTIYSAFLDIKNSISWYQEIHFLISWNAFPDVKNSTSWYQEIIHIKNRIPDIKKSFLNSFLDIKKYNSWY